ncbi:MAG: adenine/guanine/hypoxanthine permease, partial [Actinomycetota bacterium]|nr:adenine/guanine/hypoxanthine permease [Actinomycetota bacterium]
MAKTDDSIRIGEAGPGGGLDGFFKITARGSTVRTEVIAGITTWLTMAYILFVNPSILGLGGKGLEFGQVLTVTA